MAREFRIVVVTDPNPARAGLRSVDKGLVDTQTVAKKLAEAMVKATQLNVARFTADKAVVKKGLQEIEQSAKKTEAAFFAAQAAMARSVKVQASRGMGGAPVMTPKEFAAKAHADITKGHQAELNSLINGFNQTAVAAAKARQGITEAGKAVQQTTPWYASLAGLIRAGIYAKVTKEVVDLADTFTNLQNRLRAVTPDASQVAGLTDTLYQVAQRTRSEWGAVNEVFVRTSGALNGLGYSQREVIEFTETLTKAVKMSGASSVEANNAMVQLSQGLASGTLRGDELRSVLEQLPTVADIIAKSLGVTRGQLRQLGMEGKITTQQIITAFQKSKSEIDANFGKTVPTIAEQFVMLKNAAIKAIGELMPVLGPLISALGTVIKLAGETIGVVAKFTGLVGGGLAQTGREIVDFLTHAEKIPPTLREAEAYAERYKQEIADGSVWHRKMAEGMKEEAEAADRYTRTLQRVNAGLGDEADQLYLLEKAQGNVLAMHTALEIQRGKDIQGIYDSITAMDELIKRMDVLIGRAGIDQVKKAASDTVVNTIGAILTSTADESLRIVKLKEAIKDLAREADPAAAKAAKLRDAEVALDEAVKQGIISAEAAKKVHEGLYDVEIKTAAKRAKGLSDEEKEWQKLRQAFLQAHEAANPVIAAQNELAETQDLVNKVVARYPQLEEQGIRIMEVKRAALAAQLDPLGAVLDKLREEVLLQGLSNKERERELAIRSALAQLPADQQDAARPQVAREVDNAIAARQAQDLETEAIRRRAEMLSRIRGPQADYAADMATLNVLVQDGTITQREYVREMERLQAQFGSVKFPDEAYTSFFDSVRAGIDAVKEDLLNTGPLIEAVFTDAFKGIEDAVVNAVTETDGTLEGLLEGLKSGFADMVHQVLQDLTRLLLRLLIIQAIKFAIEGATGGGGGAITSILDKVSGFATGGSFKVPGHGGTDSQLVMFKATPGERVDVSTGNQQRLGISGGGQAPAAAGPVTVLPAPVVIVDDPRKTFTHIRSDAGRREIIAVLEHERETVRGILK